MTLKPGQELFGVNRTHIMQFDCPTAVCAIKVWASPHPISTFIAETGLNITKRQPISDTFLSDWSDASGLLFLDWVL